MVAVRAVAAVLAALCTASSVVGSAKGALEPQSLDSVRLNSNNLTRVKNPPPHVPAAVVAVGPPGAEPKSLRESAPDFESLLTSPVLWLSMGAICLAVAIAWILLCSVEMHRRRVRSEAERRPIITIEPKPSTKMTLTEDNSSSGERSPLLGGSSASDSATDEISVEKIVETQTQQSVRSKLLRIQIVFGLVFAYTCALVLAGAATGSLALLSEATHMISDLVAYGISWHLMRQSRHPPSWKYPFGRLRANVLGGFFSACFLLASALVIFVDACHRLIDQHTMENPVALVYLGAAGMTINFFCSCLLGAHSHIHVAQYSETENAIQSAVNVATIQPGRRILPKSAPPLLGSAAVPVSVGSAECAECPADQSDLNMYGSMLHSIGDFFGSAIVFGVGMTMVYTEIKLDAFGSLAISGLLLLLAIPMGLKCAEILMETPPKGLSWESLHTLLTSELQPMRAALEDIRVWRLDGVTLFALVRIRCDRHEMVDPVTVRTRRVLGQFAITRSVVEAHSSSCDGGGSKQLGGDDVKEPLVCGIVQEQPDPHTALLP